MSRVHMLCASFSDLVKSMEMQAKCYGVLFLEYLGIMF